MRPDPDLASAAALLGEPARASMLAHLLDGRSWTATELARVAGVSASTASSHLGKLVAGGWLTIHPQGRYRYFRLAHAELAAFLESLARWAPSAPPRTPGERRASERLRQCRLCYDHLASQVGVALCEHLLSQGKIHMLEGEFMLQSSGAIWLREIGIDAIEPHGKPCMDWSERRLHLAGPLGRTLAQGLLNLGWFQRDPKSRALWMTPMGEQGFQKSLDWEIPIMRSIQQEGLLSAPP